MSAVALTSTTRSALSAMVEKEARRVGSRTVAYEHVAQMIGVSSSWVKKFLANTGEVGEPRITLFQNIRVAYSNLCERVEQQNRTDELRLRAIGKNLDEITEGFGAESQTEGQTMVGQ